jgi:hypothetical protein
MHNKFSFFVTFFVIYPHAVLLLTNYQLASLQLWILVIDQPAGKDFEGSWNARNSRPLELSQHVMIYSSEVLLILVLALERARDGPNFGPRADRVP